MAVWRRHDECPVQMPGWPALTVVMAWLLLIVILAGLPMAWAAAIPGRQGPRAPLAAELRRAFPSQFGASTAISGSTALVGGPSAYKLHDGAVRVYQRSAGTWRWVTTLHGDPVTYGENFGGSVAVSTTTAGPVAVIGADGAGNNYEGAVYIFVRSRSAWRLQTKLSDPGSASLSNPDNFGCSVAVSGTTAVMGACGTFHNSAAYIFVRSGRGWHEQAKLVDPELSGESGFGSSVAISGSTAVIGGGKFVHIYQRSGRTWHQEAKLADPAIGSSRDYFGDAVAVSGSVVIAGSFGARNNAGLSYVYVWSRSGWRRQATLTDPNAAHNAWFGFAVAISGGRALIGTPNTSTHRCGAVFEFVQWTRWREREKVANPSCRSADLFGSAVALSGRTAVIGAPGKSTAYALTIP